jgi:DNA-binding response OmpR family regulator
MRLLVAEDDLPLATALRRGLSAQGFAVDVVPSVASARGLIGVNPYDLIVLDLGLPDMDGLVLLQELRAKADHIPVLILTARSALEDRVLGLDSGADDYVQKPFAFPELVARIRALLRRGAQPATGVLRVGCVELVPHRHEVRCGGAPVGLTAKEFAILEYFVRHAGMLVTRTMLLEHCWDESYDGLSNLVDVYVGRLRRKLEVAGCLPLLHTVRGVGFIFEERAR